MKRRIARGAAVWCIVSTLAAAQCQGNGGLGRLDSSVQVVGGVVTTTVTGGPGEGFFVFISPRVAATPVAGLGTVCLDLGDPGFGLAYEGLLDATGGFSAPFPVPNNMLWRDIVFFMQGLVTDPLQPLGFALTNTLRKDYELPDSHTAVTPLATARHGHAAAHLPDRDWIFLCGGSGDTSTDIYHPICRCVTPGPALSVSRSAHTATTLADGRVLIVGGVSSSLVQATCEIFDPVTLTVQPAAPLSTGRQQHRAVRLDDGRVLVVGGTVSSVVAPLGMWFINNVLDSAEIYDPATDSWSPAANTMQNKRTECEVVRMPDGKVLVIAGIEGETAQVFMPGPFLISDTCDVFDPATNAFTPGPWFPQGAGRYDHAATLRPDGSVFVSGGTVSSPGTLFQAAATATTLVLSRGEWFPGPPLPEPRTNHSQAVLPSGSVLIAGGGNNIILDTCLVFDGAAVSPAASLPSVRMGFTLTTLNDGSSLVAGGLTLWAPIPFQIVSAEASIYTPGN